MIYTDGTHLITDGNIEELHAFAKKIGPERSWFQSVGHRIPHYDLTTKRMSKKALANGAKAVTTQQLLKTLKEKHET